MNRQLIAMSVLLSLAACSTGGHKQAGGSFDYAEADESQPLIIPEGLKTPKYSEEFYVSNQINQEGPVGKSVDIRAPSLTLPVATSSRVEPKAQQATIWFDQVLDDKNLTDFIKNAIAKQLEKDNVQEQALSSNVIESGWYDIEQISGPWLFESIEVVESMRYKYELAPKPHGRSVALTVSLVDYKSDANQKWTLSTNNAQK